MAVKRTLPSYFRKFIFVVGSSAISLGVLMIIVEYHNALESSLPKLSVVHLDDGRRYHWLSKLWCNETQPSRLCYYHPEDNIRGRPFHENTLRLLKKLNIFDHTERYVDPANYLKENDPVFLTAADSSYFGPVKVAIRSVQEYFPNKTIIFYDLGMTKHEVKELKSFCNLEYVRFPFEDFPGYFRQLTQYRWKPVIVAVRAASSSLFFITMKRS
ncbi:DUF1647 domain containing protein [Trichuris trichiura]|uniref:DUF1647 domain containing protein n=1 Tax=Trichuris trichiura TaxID=36087 RepID=A0A077ZEY6_TRITR|nr:DUF1647 domain containing protein [Trichuris trichiura]